jgi:hypothetical protein
LSVRAWKKASFLRTFIKVFFATIKGSFSQLIYLFKDTKFSVEFRGKRLVGFKTTGSLRRAEMLSKFSIWNLRLVVS